MTSSLFLIIFLIELLVLFFISQQMIKSLSLICYRFFRHEQAVIYVLAFLFFPGTLLHELAHMMVASLLFVRVGKIELFPYKTEDGIRLGSVAIAHTDPFRRALTGLAPIFFGIIGIFLASYYLIALPFQPWYLDILLLVCIIFEIGNTMFSSKKDVEGIPALAIVLTLFIVAAYFLGLRIPSSVITYFNAPPVRMLLQNLTLYMLIPLGIDGMILLFSKFVTRR